MLKAPVTCAAGVYGMPDKFIFKYILLARHAIQMLPRKERQTPEVSIRALKSLEEHRSGLRRSKVRMMSDV